MYKNTTVIGFTGQGNRSFVDRPFGMTVE